MDDPAALFNLVGPPLIGVGALLGLNQMVINTVIVVVGKACRDRALGVLCYALLVFPGTAMHEFSHWMAAKLLGVPARWPVLGLSQSLQQVRESREIVLGYVQIAHTDVVRRSLIGGAPFVVGCLLISLLADQVFLVGGGQEPIQVLRQGLVGIEATIATLGALITGVWTLASGDYEGWLRLYLIFAIANGMLPSPSDREAWPWLGLWIGGVGAAVYLLIGVPEVPAEVSTLALLLVQGLTFAILVTVVIDGAFLLLTWPLVWAVNKWRRPLYR